jgi:hypothetical protein
MSTEKKAKNAKPHSTTLYRKTRVNPNNPNEEQAFRKAVEVAARKVEGYRLSTHTDKKTKQVKIYLEGKVSKVHERMEEQWLASMGLLDENGYVIYSKLEQLIAEDENQKQRLIEEEDEKNKAVKSKLFA